jgi:phosphomannomutase / phosphoglucomutase
VSIYRSSDICGSTAELTPEHYRRWGSVLGGSVERGAKFVVGGDTRSSTPQFLAALVEGLCGAGVDCIHLGLLPTPMIDHAKRRLRAEGCAIVTASHHPAGANGLTWMVGDRPPMPEDVDRLRRAAERSKSRRAAASATAPRELDVSFDYVACLQETWVDSLHAQLRVVLDPMHGGWAGRARRYFNAIFPQCLVSVIHDVADPEFAGRTPDCSRAEHLEDLCAAVYRERAHLGIAFDGDGDCLALVDNEAVPLSADETTAVLLDSFGPQLQGNRFIYDLQFSDRIVEKARGLGAEPLSERSGRAFVRTRMQQTQALFGAETSGHYFFAELQGGDDALFAACRTVAHLAKSGRTMDNLRRECPAVFITPNLRVPLDAAAQTALISQLREAWSQYPQTTVDGVRIEVPGGWALVRGSAADPSLTFRFESIDWPGLDDLVQRFCRSLPEVGDVLWSSYRATLGMG